MGFQEPCLVDRLRCWKDGTAREGWKLRAPSHTPCPVYLFYLAVPELYSL